MVKRDQELESSNKESGGETRVKDIIWVLFEPARGALLKPF